jgi:hypothetical protein
VSIYHLGRRAGPIHALLKRYQAKFAPQPHSQSPAATAKGITTAAAGLNQACRRVLHRTLSQQKGLFTVVVGEKASVGVSTVAARCSENLNSKSKPEGSLAFQRKGLRKSFTFTSLGNHLYGSRRKRARYIAYLICFISIDLHLTAVKCFITCRTCLILWKMFKKIRLY